MPGPVTIDDLLTQFNNARNAVIKHLKLKNLELDEDKLLILILSEMLATNYCNINLQKDNEKFGIGPQAKKQTRTHILPIRKVSRKWWHNILGDNAFRKRTLMHTVTNPEWGGAEEIGSEKQTINEFLKDILNHLKHENVELKSANESTLWSYFAFIDEYLDLDFFETVEETNKFEIKEPKLKLTNEKIQTAKSKIIKYLSEWKITEENNAEEIVSMLGDMENDKVFRLSKMLKGLHHLSKGLKNKNGNQSFYDEIFNPDFRTFDNLKLLINTMKTEKLIADLDLHLVCLSGEDDSENIQEIQDRITKMKESDVLPYLCCLVLGNNDKLVQSLLKDKKIEKLFKKLLKRDIAFYADNFKMLVALAQIMKFNLHTKSTILKLGAHVGLIYSMGKCLSNDLMKSFDKLSVFENYKQLQPDKQGGPAAYSFSIDALRNKKETLSDKEQSLFSDLTGWKNSDFEDPKNIYPSMKKAISKQNLSKILLLNNHLNEDLIASLKEDNTKTYISNVVNFCENILSEKNNNLTFSTLHKTVQNFNKNNLKDADEMSILTELQTLESNTSWKIAKDLFEKALVKHLDIQLSNSSKETINWENDNFLSFLKSGYDAINHADSKLNIKLN